MDEQQPKAKLAETSIQQLNSEENYHFQPKKRGKLGGLGKVALAASLALGSAGCFPKPEPTPEPSPSFTMPAAIEQSFNVEKGQLVDVNPGDIISGGDFGIGARGLTKEDIINAETRGDVIKFGAEETATEPWIIEMQIPGQVYTDTGTTIERNLSTEEAKQYLSDRVNTLIKEGGAINVNVVKYFGLDWSKPHPSDIMFQPDHNFDNVRSQGWNDYFYKARPWPTTEQQVSWEGKLTLGPLKNLKLLGDYLPNGHITNFRNSYFYAENNMTMLLNPMDENTTLEYVGQFGGYTAEPVLRPDSSKPFMKDAAKLTSILQLDKNNSMHLIGIGQFEQWVTTDANGMSSIDQSKFTATVGKAESFDGGKSWENVEPIISGDDFQQSGEKPTGAGQPAAYYNEKDGYVYIMYIDWSSQKNIQHSDQLYLSRAKANGDGTLGTIEYLHQDGTFYQNMEPEKLKSVIPAFQGAEYTAQPSISFNTALNKYLCVFETDKGFYATTSEDLVNWDSNPQKILDFAKIGVNNGSSSYMGHPTLLSDGLFTNNDKTTGTSGVLYFSYSPDLNRIPPNLGGMDFTFNQGSQTNTEPSITPSQ